MEGVLIGSVGLTVFYSSFLLKGNELEMKMNDFKAGVYNFLYSKLNEGY